MKKVKVNAQARAMISMLESIYGVIIIILYWYFKGTSLLNLILAMVLYHIILPHAFLMNTSETKNRIVELGWKNVIKNIVGISTNSVGNFEIATMANLGSNTSQIGNKKGEKKMSQSKYIMMY